MERRPLVVIAGRVQELPLTDTLAAVGDDDMAYSKRVDFVTEDQLYRGEAAVGTSESSPAWRIRRIIISPDGDISEMWAGGSALFNKSWDLRATYTYS